MANKMGVARNILEREREEVESIVRDQIKAVNREGLTNYDIDPRANFHLDTTKLVFHREREKILEKWWARGDVKEIPPKLEERVAPITIDIALTQKCKYACTFCYAGLQKNPESPLPWKVYKDFLDDCIEIGHKPGEGVRAISLVSDGESTENPLFYDFIRKAKENKIDVASATHGAELKKEELPMLVKNLTYLRFNFGAGKSKAYADIMGTTEDNFYKVSDIIREVIKLKKELGSNISLGLQMVLMPEYADQTIPLALYGRELGVDYTVIKHCSDDEDGRLGVDYSWYVSELATDLLKTAEALSTPEYSVQAKWSKIRTGRDRKYSKCFGTPLMLQMSGTGLVAPCGGLFHKRYKQHHIGHLKNQRFKDIWAGKRYWEVMNNLGSGNFNPKYDCTALCLQDKVNEVLFDIFENGNELPDITGKKEPIGINYL